MLTDFQLAQIMRTPSQHRALKSGDSELNIQWVQRILGGAKMAFRLHQWVVGACLAPLVTGCRDPYATESIKLTTNVSGARS